jgi:hypothetical protein
LFILGETPVAKGTVKNNRPPMETNGRSVAGLPGQSHQQAA